MRSVRPDDIREVSVMRNRPYFVRLAIFVVALLFALPAGGAAFAADETAAVDAVRGGFNAAFNAGDAGAIGRLFDAEGMLLPPGMPAVAGAEKITARYAGYFGKTRSQFELKPGDIRICEGWAFLNAEFARTDTPKAGGNATSVEGHCLMVLRKQADGSWRIFRDIWNEAARP